MSDGMTIDGHGPLSVRRPAEIAEAGDAVREARAAGRAVYPVGGGTQIGLGHPPTKPGFALDSRGLDRVIDYPARDMTVTVQAGVTAARLAEVLAAERQELPIDIPRPDAATLGGSVAADAFGPRRLGHGTLRDYVIGVTVINDRGEPAKGGGRVVKNVAGYDMPKLYTGSLGSLGLIAELTLKVKPLPESRALWRRPLAEADVGPALDAVHAGRTRPTAVELTWTPADGWHLLVGFEGNEKAVAWQVGRLKEETPGGWGEAPAAAWGELRDFPLTDEGPLAFRLSVLPSALPAALADLRNRLPLAAVQVHAGDGVILGRLAGGAALDDARPLGESASPAVITRCPTGWKPHLSVWGRPRGDWQLMRAVKAALDPDGVFNPGRFVGGI